MFKKEILFRIKNNSFQNDLSLSDELMFIEHTSDNLKIVKQSLSADVLVTISFIDEEDYKEQFFDIIEKFEYQDFSVSIIEKS